MPMWSTPTSLTRVVDLVEHRIHVQHRRRMRLRELLVEGFDLLRRLAGLLHRRHLRALVRPFPRLLVGQEHRAEGQLDHAAFLRDRDRQIVGQVAVPGRREVAQARMARDHRDVGDAQHVAHRVVGDVRDVDDDAEAIHFGHDLFAERAQPAPLVRFDVGRVRDAVVVAVAQRDVADAAVEEELHLAPGRRRSARRSPCPSAA